FPRWINDSLRYKLPLTKGEIHLSHTLFEVDEMFFSMRLHHYLMIDLSQNALRLQHQEDKLVSTLTLIGDAVTYPYDPLTDTSHLSEFLQQLDFIPRLWIIRRE